MMQMDGRDFLTFMVRPCELASWQAGSCSDFDFLWRYPSLTVIAQSMTITDGLHTRNHRACERKTELFENGHYYYFY